MNHKHKFDENNVDRDTQMGVPGAGPEGAGMGSVVDRFAGQSLTDPIDSAREYSYWRDNYSERPYVARGATYEDYGPAYGFGIDAVTRYPGRAFDEIEPAMSRAWAVGGGTSMLGWSDAKHAARDAWNHANGHGNPNMCAVNQRRERGMRGNAAAATVQRPSITWLGPE